MAGATRNCFFMMPFLPELNYFFLYVQEHLGKKHGIRCERADSRVLTIPVLEKIQQFILASDFIIADASQRNPNVFYELGLAHAYGKPVILITGDKVEDAPSDVRHFEFIKYNLSEHAAFLYRLDNAIFHLFSEQYTTLYRKGEALLAEFNAAVGLCFAAASIEEFQHRIVQAERIGPVADLQDPKREAEFLLPRVVGESSDVMVIKRITDWIDRTFGMTDHGKDR